MKSVAALLTVLMIWGAGLLAFAARVQRSTPAPEPQVAEGVAVLTGASNLRLEAGLHLLEDGKAQRLLISGVNRKTTRGDIQGMTKAAKGLYDCCVDLGFTAADTIGNGRETAEWAKAMDYDDIIVVTADYHMPRAMLELRSAAPHVVFHPYPVRTETLDARNWWRTGPSARRMMFEYSKYLTILGREAFLSLGPKHERAAARRA